MLSTVAPVLAVEKPDDPHDRRATNSPRLNAPRIATTSPAVNPRSCQTREKAIKQQLNHLIQLATSIQTKFNQIVQRTQNYYNSSVVPSGKSVPNHDQLMANIQTKKTAVQTALDTARADTNDFSCESDSPKNLLRKFHTDMQTVKQALKDYRTSIRNLIVAVRSVAGKNERNATRSAGP